MLDIHVLAFGANFDNYYGLKTKSLNKCIWNEKLYLSYDVAVIKWLNIMSWKSYGRTLHNTWFLASNGHNAVRDNIMFYNETISTLKAIKSHLE